MNNTTIVGRLTKDPVLKTVNVGGVQTPVLNFWLAVDDGQKKDQNGNKIGVEFFRCTAWRGAAEAIAKYRTKGSAMAVAGAVHLDKFADQQNGGFRWYLGIPKPYAFEFVGSNGETTERVMNDIPAEEVEIPMEETPWG